MNWKSGLFRVWLAVSACWIAIVALTAYYSVVVPHLQNSFCSARFDACFYAYAAHPEFGDAISKCNIAAPPSKNFFDQFDSPEEKKALARARAEPPGLFDDLIPHYGWFGDPLPSCDKSVGSYLNFRDEVTRSMGLAVAVPLVLIILWWIGVWIAAGFRRTTG